MPVYKNDYHAYSRIRPVKYWNVCEALISLPTNFHARSHMCVLPVEAALYQYERNLYQDASAYIQRNYITLGLLYRCLFMHVSRNLI